MENFLNFKDAIATLNTDSPILCLTYEKTLKNINSFLSEFPGKTFYAVKTNPDNEFVKFVMENGIKN